MTLLGEGEESSPCLANSQAALDRSYSEFLYGIGLSPFSIFCPTRASPGPPYAVARSCFAMILDCSLPPPMGR